MSQILRSMGMFWNLSSIAVFCHFAFVTAAALWIGQIFNIIPNSQHHLVGHQPMIHHSCSVS